MWLTREVLEELQLTNGSREAPRISSDGAAQAQAEPYSGCHNNPAGVINLPTGPY